MDLSIIIVTYNSKDYLSDLMDSLLKYDNINEIIFVDNNSSDNTIELINSYKLSNVKIIKNNTNLKAGAARNIGVRSATSKYVMFIDSDDYLKDDILNKAYNLIEKDKSDVVYFKYEFYNHETKQTRKAKSLLSYDKLYYEANEAKLVFVSNLVYYSVNYLYKRDLIINNDIKYGEGYIYEDYEFMILIAKYLNRLSILDEVGYVVREHNSSATKINFNNTYHFDNFEIASKKCFEIIEDCNDDFKYYVNKHLLLKGLFYLRKRTQKRYLKGYDYLNNNIDFKLECIKLNDNKQNKMTTFWFKYYRYIKNKYVMYLINETINLIR